MKNDFKIKQSKPPNSGKVPDIPNPEPDIIYIPPIDQPDQQNENIHPPGEPLHIPNQLPGEDSLQHAKRHV